MTLRGKGLAIGLGIVAGAALVTTIFMSRSAGEMMGATDAGRMLLSQGAIVVDVAVCVAGMSATAFLMQRGWLRKSMGAVFLVLTLGLVTLAVGSIMNFVSAERISVSRAAEDRLRLAEERRQQQRQDALARRHAAEEAAKQQREAQERLAKTQLGFMQSEVQGAKGRERKVLGKDFAANASKIIAEIGKTAAPAEEPSGPAPPPEESRVVLRTEVGPELMAEFSGYSQNAISTVQIAGIAIALVIIEALFSMGAGLAWSYKEDAQEVLPPMARTAAVAAMVVDGTAMVIEALPPPRDDKPADDAPVAEPAKAVNEPPPVAPPLGGEGKFVDVSPAPVRVPLPGATASLVGIGFPVDGRPEGVQRPRQEPKTAAQRFVTWMRAMDLAGSYGSERIGELLAEFCVADHREQPAMGSFLNALSNTRGVDKKRPWIDGGNGKREKASSWRYVISPGKFPKVKPVEQGAQVVRPPAFFRELESEPVMRREWAHLARRYDRTRKQRGSRMGRRAA